MAGNGGQRDKAEHGDSCHLTDARQAHTAALSDQVPTSTHYAWHSVSGDGHGSCPGVSP